MDLSSTYSLEDDTYWLSIRAQFPGLHSHINDIYLDSAASAQQPQCVIDTVNTYISQQHANVHRSLYDRAELATSAYEEARDCVQHFIHAASRNEIVWTSGATEAINIVAHCFTRAFMQTGDAIIISIFEHHANFVPWQQIAAHSGFTLHVIGLTSEGTLDYEQYDKCLNNRTKLVAMTHQSNALGTTVDIKRIIASAALVGAKTLIDASQSIVHSTINVHDLNCDFLVFSGHKLFGPTGIGVLYGKEALLTQMPPYNMGGEMITHVSLERTTFQPPPLRFEAGTPNISGAIGLGAAIKWLSHLPVQKRYAREKMLTALLIERLTPMPHVYIMGDIQALHAIVSLTFGDESVNDVATLLNEMHIAVRTGHHCAMPLMHALQLDEGTLRVSLTFYNTQADILQFCTSLKKALSILTG